MMKKVVSQDLTERIENVEKVRNLVHSDRRLSIRTMAVQLNLDKEKLCAYKRAWTEAQQLDSPPCNPPASSSQGALCQVVSGPKIDY
jgi:hypothetical protein